MRRQAISRCGARHGAARRPGRRPRRVVGEGVLRRRRTRRSAEIIAAFEQETGKEVELVLPSHDRAARARSRRRSRPGSRPISCSVWRDYRPIRLSQWAYEDRLVDLTDDPRPFAGPVRPRRCWSCATLLNGKHGPARLSTRCRWGRDPTMFTSGTACWSRPASPSPTSRRSGRHSGRSGATGCSRRCVSATGRATTSTASALPDVGAGERHARSQLEQFHARPTTPNWLRPASGKLIIDDSGDAGAGLIKTHGAATPRSTARAARRPTSMDWTQPSTTTSAFLAQRGRDDAEPIALDPERAEARACPTTTTRTPRRSNGRTAPMASRSSSEPASSARRRSSRRAGNVRPGQGVRALPGGARAGSRTGSTFAATACCRRCASCSTSRSGSTRAIRIAWRSAIQILTRPQHLQLLGRLRTMRDAWS